MGQDNLYTQSDGLHSFARAHADVAEAMTGATEPRSYAESVTSSHGTIASQMQRALDGTIEARSGSRRSTSERGRELADALRKTARAYDGVDDNAAVQLRTAADAVDGTATATRSGTSGSGGGGMKNFAETFTAAGKDAAGALGGILGPLTSGVGSAASSLGSGVSSAAGAAANSIAQAAKAGATPMAAGGVTQNVSSTEKGSDAKESGATAGRDSNTGRAPGERVMLARTVSERGTEDTVV